MSSENNVKKIDNEYTRSNPQRQKILARKKMLKRRRLLVFGIFATIVFASFTVAIFQQNTRLKAKQLEKQQVEMQLAELEEQKEMLKVQIAKLEDDEYLAKLARKEYFLSEEGEIILVIPESDEKQGKKDEKE